MDRGRTKFRSTASKLIALAIPLVGSAEAVRRAIGCSAKDFEEYRSGAGEPPIREFGRLVTLIVDEQGKVIEKNSRKMQALSNRRPGKS